MMIFMRRLCEKDGKQNIGGPLVFSSALVATFFFFFFFARKHL